LQRICALLRRIKGHGWRRTGPRKKWTSRSVCTFSQFNRKFGDFSPQLPLKFLSSIDEEDEREFLGDDYHERRRLVPLNGRDEAPARITWDYERAPDQSPAQSQRVTNSGNATTASAASQRRNLMRNGAIPAAASVNNVNRCTRSDAWRNQATEEWSDDENVPSSDRGRRRPDEDFTSHATSIGKFCVFLL